MSIIYVWVQLYVTELCLVIDAIVNNLSSIGFHASYCVEHLPNFLFGPGLADMSKVFVTFYQSASSAGSIFLNSCYIWTYWKKQDILLDILNRTSVPYEIGTERKQQAFVN